VLHDFAVPRGLHWAIDNPERFASAVLINTGALADYRWHYLAKIWRTPVAGELFTAPTTRSGLRTVLRHGNPRGLPRAFVDRMYDDLDAGTNRAILSLYRAQTIRPGRRRRVIARRQRSQAGSLGRVIALVKSDRPRYGPAPVCVTPGVDVVDVDCRCSSDWSQPPSGESGSCS